MGDHQDLWIEINENMLLGLQKHDIIPPMARKLRLDIFENDYTETQQWLHIEFWIRKAWNFIPTNQPVTSNLVTVVSEQRAHDNFLISHLALEGDFTTSELQAINWCCMTKGIFSISNISNHQGTNINKSVIDNFTNFNMIYDYNWTRKYQTTIAEWKTQKKEMIILCDGSKYKLRTPLGHWRLDDKKYITSRQWVLYRDHHII